MARNVRYRILPDFERAYLVGSDGSVWSRRSQSGKLKNSWRKLTPSILNNGYLIVTLVKDRKRYYRLVHRLVLTAFVGPCPPGRETRHFPNRDRTDNRLENLSWGTKKHNDLDKDSHGTRQNGEKHGMALLTETDVKAIRKSRLTQAKLATIYGVAASTISAIVRRITWTSID